MPETANTLDLTIERLAAVLCAKPVSTADSMRIYQCYLDESEREQWRDEARDIVSALIELGWTPPAEGATEPAINNTPALAAGGDS